MAITAASLTQGIGNALKGALCLSLNVTEPLSSIAVPLIRFAATGAGTIEGEAGLSLINGIQRTRSYLRQFACDEDPATAPPPGISPLLLGANALLTTTSALHILTLLGPERKLQCQRGESSTQAQSQTFLSETSRTIPATRHRFAGRLWQPDPITLPSCSVVSLRQTGGAGKT